MVQQSAAICMFMRLQGEEAQSLEHRFWILESDPCWWLQSVFCLLHGVPEQHCLQAV